MKIYLLVCIPIFILIPLSSQKKNITLEDIFENGVFRTNGVADFKFSKDGESYTRWVDSKIIRFDLRSSKELEVVMDATIDAKELIDQPVDYTFSKDETSILFRVNIEKIYRNSTKATTYWYDIPARKLIRIFPHGKIMYPELNAGADKVAFVYENNMYYQHLLSGKIIQLTKDGKKNQIINGASDWAYEEEFKVLKCYEWSMTGDEIAFIKFDEKAVKEVTLNYYNDHAYPDEVHFKYPKVGEEISKVSVWNYNVKKNKLQKINLGTLNVENSYIPRIRWTFQPNMLCVMWVNRSQNQIKLVLANTKSNSSKVLLEENNAYYVEPNPRLIFTSDGQHFLWSSEQSGWRQLYRYSMTGRLLDSITRGTNELTEIIGLNKNESKVFFQRAENRGLDRKIYSVYIDGSNLNCLTPSSGVHQARLSDGGKYLIHSTSTIDQVPTYSLIDSSGLQIRLLEENKALSRRMEEYTISPVELGSVANSKGDQLNTILIKPMHFDSSKKYPVLMFLYGGPGSQEVMNRWGSMRYYWWFQMLAQKDYIICVSDQRGTGGRGELFKKMTHKQLGKLETEDQIEIARYLSGLPYVDGKRIGIFGWSYGGYLSTLCILKGNEVFKSAIAVAPVTNWKWYDCIYTERFMGDMKNNASSYQENSPVYFADRLKGNYLLIHGMVDDNVHFQNSAEMIKELIKNKKQFDCYFYPNRNHSITGDYASMHLFTKLTNFVLEKI